MTGGLLRIKKNNLSFTHTLVFVYFAGSHGLSEINHDFPAAAKRPDCLIRFYF